MKLVHPQHLTWLPNNADVSGYAKMIVVDLAFLFEGYNEQTLPERVLGCARLKNVEFGKKLRFVESVD